MNEINLPDGTRLVPMEPIEKSFLEKDMQEVFNKYQAVLVPVLINDLSSISAGLNIYKKVENGEKPNTTEETTKID